MRASLKLKSREPIPPSSPIGDDCLLDPRGVAKRLGVGKRTFERMLSSGAFPACDLRIGRLTKWEPATVRAWVQAEKERQARPKIGGRR